LLHRYKGTPWAIRQALENIGFRRISIREWTELRTPPHTFAVEISSIDSDQMRNAERCIREYKPERSHLISLIGKLPLLEQAEHVETVVSQHRHILWEYYPWPELYYGSPGLVYSGTLEYGGPYKYGQDISYGEYPDGVQ
ncbi:MAG: phage tail protein, partial [Synergistaceae bacterium]